MRLCFGNLLRRRTSSSISLMINKNSTPAYSQLSNVTSTSTSSWLISGNYPTARHFTSTSYFCSSDDSSSSGSSSTSVSAISLDDKPIHQELTALTRKAGLLAALTPRQVSRLSLRLVCKNLSIFFFAILIRCASFISSHIYYKLVSCHFIPF